MTWNKTVEAKYEKNKYKKGSCQFVDTELAGTFLLWFKQFI
ncbi:hypothetical protein [Paenibacillus amylolyticus]|nr:hypothetical protein [Paenibacillus amylolyticus]